MGHIGFRISGFRASGLELGSCSGRVVELMNVPGGRGAGFVIARLPSSTLLPFLFGGVSLLKPTLRKKGTLIIKGLLGNLDCHCLRARGSSVGLCWVDFFLLWFGHLTCLDP